MDDIILISVFAVIMAFIEKHVYDRGYKKGYKIGCIETNIKNMKK